MKQQCWKQVEGEDVEMLPRDDSEDGLYGKGSLRWERRYKVLC